MLARSRVDTAFSDLPFAYFNCSFTRTIRPVPGSGFNTLSVAGRMSVAGNEAYITDREIDGLPYIGRFQIAGIDAFVHDYARVIAQLPIELPGAHVDGMNPSRARLEQAVRKAAGGGAEIRNNEPIYVDAEVQEGGFEFQSAAAGVAEFRGDFDAAFGRNELPGFGCFLTVDEDFAGHDERTGFSRVPAGRAAGFRDPRRFYCSESTRISMDDEVGDFDNRRALGPDDSGAVWARRALFLSHAARIIEAVNCREGDLALGGVFACRFAESFGRFLDVEDVVHDLKRQADVFAVIRERLYLRGVATGADSSHAYAGFEESTRLNRRGGATVEQFFGGWGLPLAFDIRDF